MAIVRVHAGPHARRQCPVFVDLLPGPSQALKLFQLPGRRPRAYQIEPHGDGVRLWWMLHRLEPGETLEYELIETPARRPAAHRLHWEGLGAGRLQLNLAGRPIAIHDMAPERSWPWLRPLYPPGMNGPIEAVWVEAPLAGIPHVRSEVQGHPRTTDGAVFATLERHGRWRGPSGERLADEVFRCTAYATPGELHLMDLTISVRATAGPVHFRTPGQRGLLQIALPTEMPEGVSIRVLNQAGAEGPGEVWGRRASWLAFLSELGGLALFDHPANPGSPPAWQLNPHGIISTDPFAGLASLNDLLWEPALTLAAGEVLTFRYRWVALPGAVKPALLRQHYLNYAHPPRVEIRS